MTLSVEMITFDCADPDALAQWWAQALGGEVNAFSPGEFVVLMRPEGPRLGFQKVPDPTPGKNRVHLDFTAPDADAEVARLVGLGATETGRHSFGPEFNWVVLADPEGNAFCIAGT
ncbi:MULTISPECIES: VOC family protein [unclassified Mycolicibacterium]|uniref:VOC family protein n=1 Tax=unclassified Mycolicibacterium TaxID=2636767 RepID=UPI0012DE407D|nr:MULTISPECIES: VOC family protein [unclassified Mycolicibacterium]MUL83851.1 VOC family protein [Mycolicibacterium sp. CBMA 329]MUL90083.1 VOC family protein [Mycolicibacterium sp. CBMA 331]MUL97897.1 VOC family protein [Mycolicibacterium sp. CBMA 334]MUM39598.1 VOC family protein [Mycolicibacterium sp. CBMA 247]MUM46684.1 VOC family protein [Mycolicibacterium sp. CBMA 294]